MGKEESTALHNWIGTTPQNWKEIDEEEGEKIIMEKKTRAR